MHRTDDRKLIRTGCHVRHQLTEFESRQFRGNRIQLAANLGRRQRFHIVHVDMTWTAKQPEQHAIDLAPGPLARDSLCTQHVWQMDTQSRKAADAQGFAP